MSPFKMFSANKNAFELESGSDCGGRETQQTILVFMDFHMSPNIHTCECCTWKRTFIMSS